MTPRAVEWMRSIVAIGCPIVSDPWQSRPAGRPDLLPGPKGEWCSYIVDRSADRWPLASVSGQEEPLSSIATC